MILTVPALIAVTVPSSSTVAMSVLPDDHSAALSLPAITAINFAVFPSTICLLTGSMEIVTAAFTVTSHTAETSPNFAVIFTVPGATPVTTPPLTVARAAFSVLHSISSAEPPSIVGSSTTEVPTSTVATLSMESFILSDLPHATNPSIRNIAKKKIDIFLIIILPITSSHSINQLCF